MHRVSSLNNEGISPVILYSLLQHSSVNDFAFELVVEINYLRLSLALNIVFLNMNKYLILIVSSLNIPVIGIIQETPWQTHQQEASLYVY